MGKYDEIEGRIATYYDIQKVRVSTEHRIRQKGLDLEDWLEDMRYLEKEMKERIEAEVEAEAVWQEWLSHVKGIGPVMAGGLIAAFGYCENYENPAKMYTKAGLHVVDGKAPRRRAGVKGGWNPGVRALTWKISRQLIMARGVYARVYDLFKKEEMDRNVPREVSITEAMGDLLAEDYGPFKAGTKVKEVNFPRIAKWIKSQGIDKVRVVLSPLHIHNRARRKLAKHFLAHYWQVARELAGLPTRKDVYERAAEEEGKWWLVPLRDK